MEMEIHLLSKWYSGPISFMRERMRQWTYEPLWLKLNVSACLSLPQNMFASSLCFPHRIGCLSAPSSLLSESFIFSWEFTITQGKFIPVTRINLLKITLSLSPSPLLHLSMPSVPPRFMPTQECCLHCKCVFHVGITRRESRVCVDFPRRRTHVQYVSICSL